MRQRLRRHWAPSIAGHCGAPRRHASLACAFGLSLAAGLAGALEPDHNPPRIWDYQPSSCAVIASDSLRLRATVTDDESGVDSVLFILDRIVHPGTGAANVLMRDTVARLTTQPYEAVVSIRGLPDWDDLRGSMTVAARDRAGNVGAVNARSLVLDRHRALSGRVLNAMAAHKALAIDGHVGDWAGVPGATFENGGDRVRIASQWDRRALYVAITVSDHQLIAVRDSTNWWLGDCVELFVDPLLIRSSLRDTSHCQLFINPDGLKGGLKVDRCKGIEDRSWTTRVRCAVQAVGSVNSPADLDSGYSIEVALPWAVLGIGRGVPDTIGLDCYVTDLDAAGDTLHGISFAGLSREVNNNPSEWASVAIGGRQARGPWPLVLVFGGLLAIGVIMVTGRRSSKIPPAVAPRATGAPADKKPAR